jgi:hypothetical protein
MKDIWACYYVSWRGFYSDDASRGCTDITHRLSQSAAIRDTGDVCCLYFADADVIRHRLGIDLAYFRRGCRSLDCAVNIQATILERGSSRPLMSGFHGLFSLAVWLGRVVSVFVEPGLVFVQRDRGRCGSDGGVVEHQRQTLLAVWRKEERCCL